jgi:hypothetical protein
MLNLPGVVCGANPSPGLSTPAQADAGAPAAYSESATPVANFIAALRKPLDNPVLAKPRPRR